MKRKPEAVKARARIRRDFASGLTLELAAQPVGEAAFLQKMAYLEGMRAGCLLAHRQGEKAQILAEAKAILDRLTEAAVSKGRG